MPKDQVPLSLRLCVGVGEVLGAMQPIGSML